MKKSEVYSWRVTTEVKAALEQEARREGQSVGGLLERIAMAWLTARQQETNGGDEQARVRAIAAKTFGAIAGGDPNRSTAVRSIVRHRLAARRGR